ncbi:hypothetical protein [Trichlorobacter lovleyi]|uniref:Uncharacterized protein n=1 Tax=Trichlorobacter lovleyi (strain ATCC BAA-1151 / DSM 17278 / SZ) TaxID=398767 RepID=B3E7Y6_TRIL1|nr:hypothetical protein [Trichlorobacter lovleyi]ACD96559.1 hypothetical protein Glov_2846 [Trichlorobacter lovleyi SZ]
MILWREIDEHLRRKGIATEPLQSMCRFIEAFDPPIELYRSVNSLQAILPHLVELLSEYEYQNLDFNHKQWEDICKEIITSEQLRGYVESTRKAGKMPLRGRYETNQIYVALWSRPDEETCQEMYLKLLAHYLFIRAVLLQRIEEQLEDNLQPENYGSCLDDALLAIRNLSNDDRRVKLLDLPDLDRPFAEILDGLDANDSDFRHIRVLYKYFIGIRRPPRRAVDAEEISQSEVRKKERLKQPADIIDSAYNGEQGQEGSITDVQLVQLPLHNDKDAFDMEYLGCDPHEARSGVEIVIPKIQKALRKQPRSPRQKSQDKRKRKAGLALANQRLVSRWEALSLHEASSYLTALSDIITAKESSVYFPGRAVPQELAALGTVLFWFGQRVSNVERIQVMKYDEIKDTDGPGVVRKRDGTFFWLTRPATPTRKKLPSERQCKQAFPTTPTLFLQSGIGVERVIYKYCQERKFEHGDLLFRKKLDYYRPLFDAFLTKINQRHATRLTANRVSDHMFSAIEHHPGADVTVAMFLVGREEFLGRNPSFYTSLPTSRLEQIYCDVCHSVRDRHFKERPRQNQTRVEELFEAHEIKDHRTHVGSPFRPTPQTITQLVTYLKEIHASAQWADKSVLKLMRLHNSMTRYTAFIVAFATGFRAVRDPFLSAAEIDWKSGFAVLSDKDNEDCYNARLIWIPPVCLRQLKFFEEHQHNALARFNLLIPTLQNRGERLSNLVTGRYMFLSKRDLDTHECVALTYSPKILETNLQKKYALPFNASRHYLRSILLERGCPVEVSIGIEI